VRYIIFIFWFLPCCIFSQVNPIQQNENLIENFIENVDSDGELDFNTLFEDLEVYLEKPLDINAADEVALKESRLFNDIQINALLKHKDKFGDLIVINKVLISILDIYI